VSGAVLRLVLKLSGEALSGEGALGVDPPSLHRVVREILDAQANGVEIALVLGGGNLLRGAALAAGGFVQRVTADHMGMLATIMNALAVRDAIVAAGGRATVLSAIPIAGVADGYAPRRAKELLAAGEVVLCAGGTGNPFFTTDSAACLRAVEIEADLVLKATKVDGVYDADPRTNSNARRFDKLRYDDVIARDLEVMDLTAICLCRDHNVPIVVFDMAVAGAVRRIAGGEPLGTIIEAGA